METTRTTSTYELKDDLARMCLPQAGRDPNQKLAWMNSVCLLFLIIGLAGARRGLIAIKPAPPLEQAVPVVVEPLTLPPQETAKRETPQDNKSDEPRVNVAIPALPSVSFSVPTIGSVVVPATMAEAPPLQPLQTVAQISQLNATGENGDRPEPPYPLLAKESGQQGTVVLLLEGDGAGNVVSAEVKESSGFPILDHASADFIKRHWRLPPGDGNREFQVPITYQLQMN
jgi:TonB family protein